MLERNLSGQRSEAPGRYFMLKVFGAVSEAGSGSIVSKKHLSLYSSGLGSRSTHFEPPKIKRLIGPYRAPRVFFLYMLFLS